MAFMIVETIEITIAATNPEPNEAISKPAPKSALLIPAAM